MITRYVLVPLVLLFDPPLHTTLTHPGLFPTQDPSRVEYLTTSVARQVAQQLENADRTRQQAAEAKALRERNSVELKERVGHALEEAKVTASQAARVSSSKQNWYTVCNQVLFFTLPRVPRIDLTLVTYVSEHRIRSGRSRKERPKSRSRTPSSVSDNLSVSPLFNQTPDSATTYILSHYLPSSAQVLADLFTLTPVSTVLRVQPGTSRGREQHRPRRLLRSHSADLEICRRRRRARCVPT